MKSEVGKLTFKVPDGHPESGKKIEKAFEYDVCETEGEAQTRMREKGWKLTDMVNENLRANARSNTYQSAVIPYRPSELKPEAIQQRMVNDYIRLGVAEEVARKQVESLLAAK